jgi:hypothetical protein
MPGKKAPKGQPKKKFVTSVDVMVKYPEVIEGTLVNVTPTVIQMRVRPASKRLRNFRLIPIKQIVAVQGVPGSVGTTLEELKGTTISVMIKPITQEYGWNFQGAFAFKEGFASVQADRPLLVSEEFAYIEDEDTVYNAKLREQMSKTSNLPAQQQAKKQPARQQPVRQQPAQQPTATKKPPTKKPPAKQPPVQAAPVEEEFITDDFSDTGDEFNTDEFNTDEFSETGEGEYGEGEEVTADEFASSSEEWGQFD